MVVAKARKSLAAIWFIGAGVLFIMLLAQTIVGKYGDKADKAWAWFFPTILPTLSLIIGILVSEALSVKPNKDDNSIKEVDRFVFWLSFFLSFAYIITVNLTVFLSPLAHEPLTPLKLMEVSNLWLGPFQGLVSASLGIFFVSQHHSS